MLLVERTAAYQHSSGIWSDQPEKKVGDCTLPRPRRPDDRGSLSGRYLDRHRMKLPQCPLSGIAERNIVKLNAASDFDRLLSISRPLRRALTCVDEILDCLQRGQDTQYFLECLLKRNETRNPSRNTPTAR